MIVSLLICLVSHKGNAQHRRFLLDEEFKNKNNKWPTYNDNSNSDSDYIGIDTFLIPGLKMGATNNTARFVTVNVPIDDNRDFSIDAECKHRKGVDGEGYGIVFGGKDAGNYYSLNITASGYFELFKYENGVFVQIRPWKKIDTGLLSDFVPYSRRIGIEKMGNAWIINIDNRPKDTVYNHHLMGSRTGFIRYGNQQVEFSRLLISGYDETEQKISGTNGSDQILFNSDFGNFYNHADPSYSNDTSRKKFDLNINSEITRMKYFDMRWKDTIFHISVIKKDSTAMNFAEVGLIPDYIKLNTAADYSFELLFHCFSYDEMLKKPMGPMGIIFGAREQLPGDYNSIMFRPGILTEYGIFSNISKTVQGFKRAYGYETFRDNDLLVEKKGQYFDFYLNHHYIGSGPVADTQSNSLVVGLVVYNSWNFSIKKLIIKGVPVQTD